LIGRLAQFQQARMEAKAFRTAPIPESSNAHTSSGLIDLAGRSAIRTPPWVKLPNRFRW